MAVDEGCIEGWLLDWEDAFDEECTDGPLSGCDVGQSEIKGFTVDSLLGILDNEISIEGSYLV